MFRRRPMIALPSLRRPGLLVVLFLGGSSFAFGVEAGEPLLNPPPAENTARPVPIPDPGTDSSEPFTITPNPGMSPSTPYTGLSTPDTQYDSSGVPVECQRCRPDLHRSRGFLGWFRGHSKKNAIAEGNAMCSGCNVNPEPKFGTSYHATMQAQIAKGEAALMVLHHFDFVPCKGELNFRGQLQLKKIARRALCNPFPIIIEASRHDPALDAARRATVLSELALTPVPMERVVIGSSPARGLDGLDAELIDQNLLRLMGGGGRKLQTEGVDSGAPQPR